MTETLLLPAPKDLPEIKVPEIPPEVVEAFQKIAEKAKEIIKALAEALQPVIECTVKAIRRIWDAIARGLVPKKWWHLYKHAKKRRIRKKYEKRIRERVLAFLLQADYEKAIRRLQRKLRAMPVEKLVFFEMDSVV